MNRLVLIPALALTACGVPAPDGPAPRTTQDVLNELTLPEGVTRDMVYTRQPDPRAGPCYYYRVEGLEVLLNCIG